MGKIYFYNIQLVRWILTIMILIHHMAGAKMTQGASAIHVLAGSQIFNIPLYVDIFFVISGFLMATRFFGRQSFKQFAWLRLARLYPIILLFWAGFYVCSKMGWIYTDFPAGLKDVLGLNVFGVPWVHNHFNYTWFGYVLFWCSLFYFLLAKTGHLFYVLLVPIILTGLYQINLHAPFDLISYAPFEYIPVSMGTLRGLTGLGLGLITGALYNRLSDKRTVSITGTIVETLAIGIFMWLCMSSVPMKITYIGGLFCGAVIILCFTLKCGVISHALNRRIFTIGSDSLYAVYILSALVILTFRNAVFERPFFGKHADLGFVVTGIACIVLGIFADKCIGRPVYNFVKRKIT